jgi:hypothetical protein
MSGIAYGEHMKPGVAVLVYTLLRIAMLVAVWFMFQLLTPLRGIWAIVAALLVSGAISLVVLNKPRDAVSIGVANFFGRINERIEASKTAEDIDEDEPEREQDTEGEQQQ